MGKKRGKQSGGFLPPWIKKYITSNMLGLGKTEDDANMIDKGLMELGINVTKIINTQNLNLDTVDEKLKEILHKDISSILEKGITKDELSTLLKTIHLNTDDLSKIANSKILLLAGLNIPKILQQVGFKNGINQIFEEGLVDNKTPGNIIETFTGKDIINSWNKIKGSNKNIYNELFSKQNDSKSPLQEMSGENNPNNTSNNTGNNVSNNAGNNVSNNASNTPPEEEGTVAGIFTLIYNIVALVGLLSIILFTIVTIINFGSIKYKKKREKSDSKGGQLILRDTLEYKFFDYSNEKMEPKTKKKSFWKSIFSPFNKKEKTEIKKDPLLINLQILITNVLFFVIAIFIMVVITNVIVSGILIVRLVKAGKTDVNFFKELKPKIKTEHLIVIFVCLFIAGVSIMLIDILFKNAVEKVLFDFNKKAYLIKKSIATNLYVDKNFIEMLHSDNFDGIKELIKQKINGNVQVASKMIFTYNVYMHYKTNLSETPSEMQDFKNSFAFDNLKGVRGSSKFDPIEFLKYSDKIESIRFDDHFKIELKEYAESAKDTDSKDLLNAYKRNKIGSITIHDDIDSKLTNINNNISQNFTKIELEKSYKAIDNFVLSMFIFGLIIIISFGAFLFIYEPTRTWIGNNKGNIGESLLKFGTVLIELIWGGILWIIVKLIDAVKYVIGWIRGK